MTNGTGTTFVLHPTGRSSLALATHTAKPSSSYVIAIDLGSLELNDDQRWQFVYEQAHARRAPETFVPLRFTVIIKATTTAARQQAYNLLDRAARAGGKLQYKPEGASRDTYYYYAPSAPPRLLDERRNRWDASAPSDGYYTLYLDVELQTLPIATSDPASPVTINSLSDTLDNWTDNALTVDGDEILGSVPALVRLLITPASGQRLGRVVLFRRSAADGTLVNLTTLYEAEDAAVIYPSVAWTEIAAASRGGGAYMRCLPPADANGFAQGLRFTILNPQDCRGRFAVFGVGYDDALVPGVWTHQVRLRSGNLSQEGANDYYAASLQAWQLIFAGEFELPLTDVADVTTCYDAGPYLEWWATRTSGTSKFRLDGVLLVWVSDARLETGTALDVCCDDEGGVQAPDKLLLENLVDTWGHSTRRAYVTASDHDLRRVLQRAARGEFVELEPGEDHMMVVVQERSIQAAFLDDFESYRGNRWLFLADFDSDETWVLEVGGTVTADTGIYATGDQSIRLTHNGEVKVHQSVAYDLSYGGVWDDGDFFVCAYYVDDATKISTIRFRFVTSLEIEYFEYEKTSGFLPGWNYDAVKKSELLTGGNWQDIQYLQIQYFPLGGATQMLRVDYWRIEKADPDNAAMPNATGTVWDFQPAAGVWTVTEDVDADNAVLACLTTESNVEKSALIHTAAPDHTRLHARVLAKRDAGKVGLWVRATAATLTAGSEQGYAVLIDTSANTLLVRRYTAGIPTQLASAAFTADEDTWYVLGVLIRDNTLRAYAAAAATLSSDADVFSETHLLATVTDSTYSSGYVGLLSIDTLGRFDNVSLESIEDKVVPADEITISGQAIFRTIAPFA